MPPTASGIARSRWLAPTPMSSSGVSSAWSTRHRLRGRLALLRGKSRSSPLCGLLKRDGVTEAFELGDEAFGGAGGVAAAVVVAAEVVVELAGGEHVPGGDEQRVLDRADRFAVPDPGALALIERA